jgi:hypothetical protein
MAEFRPFNHRFQTLALALFKRKSSGPMGLRCFVRNDDVGALTDELKAFAEALLSREIPVSYQIIPARGLSAGDRARPAGPDRVRSARTYPSHEIAWPHPDA